MMGGDCSASSRLSAVGRHMPREGCRGPDLLDPLPHPTPFRDRVTKSLPFETEAPPHGWRSFSGSTGGTRCRGRALCG